MVYIDRLTVAKGNTGTSTAGTYQVITQGLHSGLHDHILHCHHLLLNSLFLHIIEQLQGQHNRRKEKMQEQQGSVTHSSVSQRKVLKAMLQTLGT